MLIEYINPDYEFKDNRGKLVQLIHEGFSQINVITCLNDSIRGGHYHKNNIELFYVITGSFTLELKKGDELEKYEIGEGTLFKVNPLISHTFYYKEDTILVSAYSNGVEMPDGSMDIFK